MKKLYMHLYRKLNKLPRKVCIEACSLCQLNCTECYMREIPNKTIIGNGYLKYDDFKKFIETNPYIEEIELSFSGEIFLNPDLLKIIKYAYEKEIALTAFNGVNFNDVSDEMLEALVKYKFIGLTISIDGVTNETYSIYRRNGNLDKVIANIKKLNKYKEKYSSKFPVLQWQFIVFEHNKNEINRAADFAYELKMDNIYIKHSWNDEDYPKTIIEENNNNFVLIREKLKQNPEIRRILNNSLILSCYQPWIRPQINWDGRLLGCSCATHKDLNINVFDVGLKKSLNSKKMNFMRKIISGKKKPDETMPCEKCCIYIDRQKNNNFINQRKIKYS